jgi:hypothetical protein
MPGNEVGDRVHNFFAQDNLSQSQNQSQVAEGNWPILNNNLWVGNQRQISGQNPNQKNYSPHQSDLQRGHIGHPLHVPQGLHFTQSPLRPEYTNNQPQNQQPTLNGYMYQRQIFQPRQDEADLLGMDTESDRHKQNPRGLSMYESQQGRGAEHHADNTRRLETSESPVSFDFFGGQQQMTDRNPGMLHAGYNEMQQQQQLQQEAMLRKMQELHRQKELSQQLDARQHNTANQIPFFPRQSSGNHQNDLINPGTQFSDASSFPWANEQHRNTILRQRGSPAVQASSTGLGFLSDQGQIPYSMNPVHQQADQSLYGVPVSNSRSIPKQFQQIPTDKTSLQQMPTFNNPFQAQQGNMFPEQGTMQDGRINSRQGFLGKNLASGMNTENFPQVNSASRNIPAHDFQGRQELVGEMAQEKSAFEASSSRDEVALDPTEEKILFGSDDNIWDAFGKSGETSNLLDGMGSWSALMQSAVAETSSSDNAIQEEWTGLPFQNRQHPSTFTNSAKKQTSLGDNNSQTTPALNFGYAPLSEGGNVKNNFNNPLGFQQHNQSERLQMNSTQRPSSSGGGSKWLNQSSLPKPLPDGEMNAKNISSKWTPQQTGTSQLFNKPSSWNMHENGYPPQNELQRQIHEEGSQNDGIWKNSTPRNADKPPNSRVSEEPNQIAQNPPPSFWKNVDSLSKSKGSEQLQQHPNKGPQFFGTPLNMYEKQAGKLQEMEQKKENSNDSYHSNNASTGGLRDIVLSDASDSRTLPSGKQKSDQVVKKPLAAVPPRKFQYHPMGNLDEDVKHSYGARQSSLSQLNSQGLKNQHQEQGYFGKPNHFTQVYNSSESGKGKSPDHRGDPKGFDHLPGYPPNRSVHADRSAGLFPPNKASQPSQNMLELLHKVDQSKEHGSTTRMSSSEHKSSSEMHEPENSDGSGGGLQRSQSSASQGFGLQLAPPSQRLPPQNHPSMDSRDNRVQSLFPSQQTSQTQGDFVSNRFGSGFPLSAHQLQHMGSQMPANQPVNVPFINRQVCQSKPLDSAAKLTGQSAEASVAAEKHDSTSANRPKQGGFPNMWTNVPEARKVTPNISQSHQSNVVESPSSAQTVEDQDEKNRGSASMEFGASSANSQGVVHNKVQQTNKNPSQKVDESQGQETIIKKIPNASPNNVASMTQRDIAAFGHSLKPNNAFHQNYSLLNQIRVMKNAEADPNFRGLKRFKGAENIPEGSKAAEQNVLGSTDPSSDNLERASSSENNTGSTRVENNPQMAPSWFNQLGNFRNGQMLSVIDSRKADAVTANAVEQPSALDKSFGGLHTLNSMEEAVNISSVAHTNQIDIAGQPCLVPTEQLAASSKAFPTTINGDISAQNVLASRPKKRKSSTSERCSWHKQISQASETLHTISTAEAEWARATNRLCDRVEDDVDLMDDVSASQKAKRRLKSTTQLMQQLIRPPPYSILSTDAVSDYESAAHYVSRLALGDACSLVSSTSSSNSHSRANFNGDNCVSDVVESFVDRARKLENELLRLDKRASVSELRLECEDVETFSVINRFAKFHGRPKPERGDSSDAAALNAQKIFPQRYVTAVPVPRNLPDRVNCLSL